MHTIFNLFVSAEVLSLRVPIGSAWLKIMYPLQALLLVVLFLKSLQTRYTYINTKDSKPLALILWLLLISVCIPFIFNKPETSTLSYTAVLLSWALTLTMLGYNLRTDLRSFLNVYCFSIFALLALSLAAFVVLDDRRIDSIFGGGTNRLGLYSVIGILISLYLITKKIPIKHKTIYKIGLPLCLICFVLTFSRSALLAFLVAALEHGVRTKRIKIAHIALMVAIAGAIVFYLNYMYLNTGDEKYVKLMYRFRINELLGHSYIASLGEVTRAIHYQNAMDLISGQWNSLIFGLGLESYRSVDFLSNLRGKDLALHSMYLQYLMGGGLLAVGCLVFFIGTLYKRILAFPQWQKDILLFIFVPSLVHAAFQPAIFSREILIYIPLLVLSCQLNEKLGTRSGRTE